MMAFLAHDDIPKLVEILYDERGTHEERGPNNGTCEQYQLAIGGADAVARHDSWCLYFVLWGFLQLLGNSMQALKQLVPAVTGSCEDFRQAARQRGQLMPIGTEPRPGDVGLVVAGNHAHHAFLVAHPPEHAGVGWTTEEGNSNNTGGSNGDGAYVRSSRWGPTDPCTRPGATNHYELVRLTDPTIPYPVWLMP